MTTADAYGHRRNVLIRAAVRIGHTTEKWDLILYPLTWVGIIANWWHPAPFPTLISLAFAAVFLTLVVVMFTGLAHFYVLCPRDTDGFILDPQAEIDRHGPALSRWHRPWYNRTTWVVGGLPVLTLLLDVDEKPTLVKALFTAVAVVAVTGSQYLYLTNHTHARLRLWCPYCRRGGTPVHTPTPVTTVER